MVMNTSAKYKIENFGAKRQKALQWDRILIIKGLKFVFFLPSQQTHAHMYSAIFKSIDSILAVKLIIFL